jgi:hypothetical protein
MAKFCTKCGNPLTEGVPCECETVNQGIKVEQTVEQTAEQQPDQQANQIIYTQPVQQANPNSAIVYLKKLFNLFKAIVRFPSTEGVKFAVSEDRNTALALIGAQAVFSALFALLVSFKFDDLFSSFGMVEDIKMNYFKIFIVTILASCVLSCAFAGIIFGISYLFKNKLSLNAALCITAVRSIIIILVTIVASLMLLLNFRCGVTLFYSGSLAGICYMIVAFPCTSLDNKNKVPLIIFISALIFGLISYFVMFKCLPLYAPDSMKESFKSISQMLTNPSGYRKNMMDGLY